MGVQVQLFLQLLASDGVVDVAVIVVVASMLP